MAPYWIIYLFPVIAILLPLKGNNSVKLLGSVLFGLLAVLLIGLRFEIGGDWVSYLWYIDQVEFIGLLEALVLSDAGYMLINWVSAYLGFGIYGVNIVCGAIFMFGLIAFCSKQPMPWLGLLVALPYLVFVVAMGYSRQATALGLVLIAFSIWDQKRVGKFCFYIVLACFFHKSAVIMLIFSFFMDNDNKLRKLILAIPLLGFIALVFSFTIKIDDLLRVYVTESQYKSSGALIRALMNLFPTVILFCFQKSFSRFNDLNVWNLFGLMTLASLVTVGSLSTVTDRFALYLSLIQIVVFSRLPSLINKMYWRTIIVIFIILYHSLVLFVWLNFADNAMYWVPYKNWIFQ